MCFDLTFGCAVALFYIVSSLTGWCFTKTSDRLGAGCSIHVLFTAFYALFLLTGGHDEFAFQVFFKDSLAALTQ